MKEKKTRWGWIYTLAFLAAFILSVIIKLTYNPLQQKYEWNDSVGKIYTDIPYGSGEAEKFDLYVPLGSSQDSYGLVVYLHAGGFTGGDKSDDADILKRLCSMGFVAAGVNYTLASETHPDANVYTQSQDVKHSIPAIKQKAEELGYPLDRMAVAGGSAGGCLALLFAYRDAADSPLPVKMVFEAVGPSSFYPEDWYGLAADKEASAAFFSVLSGKKITADIIGTPAYDEAIKDISAFMWVNENSVPTLCAYGAHDKVCPFGTVKYLVKALEDNHVPHDYIEFPHSGHGLQNDNKLARLYNDKINEYLEKYLR